LPILQLKMSARIKSCETVILVKALPRPSSKYGETVCCAGVTLQHEWKRLYPVRFRHLTEEQAFGRWQLIEFRYRLPTQDRRVESCHVFEDSIVAKLTLPLADRFGLLEPMIVGSATVAKTRGASLALVRPKNVRFRWKKKPDGTFQNEIRAYAGAARQESIFDDALANFIPSPYEFAFAFSDGDGSHTLRCGDWETHATFFKWRRQYGDAETLRRLSDLYNDEYPKRGLVFALGNMAKRPQTWQLLGVIRLDQTGQLTMI
jgi:hypothetical protein